MRCRATTFKIPSTFFFKFSMRLFIETYTNSGKSSYPKSRNGTRCSGVNFVWIQYAKLWKTLCKSTRNKHVKSSVYAFPLSQKKKKNNVHCMMTHSNIISHSERKSLISIAAYSRNSAHDRNCIFMSISLFHKWNAIGIALHFSYVCWQSVCDMSRGKTCINACPVSSDIVTLIAFVPIIYCENRYTLKIDMIIMCLHNCEGLCNVCCVISYRIHVETLIDAHWMNGLSCSCFHVKLICIYMYMYNIYAYCILYIYIFFFWWLPTGAV